MNNTVKNIGIFLGCLILCQGSGAIGTIATIPNIPTWYATLQKPAFQPPNWLFGPVWTILYTLMAVVLYKLIRSEHPARKKALIMFSIQLLLNAIWSFLFFQFHLLGISLIEISLLLSAIIYFCIIATPIHRVILYCLVPYILWVSFATMLNGSIWSLNK